MREDKFEGFISLHRKIKYSAISKRPPCTREVWQHLLLEANHSDAVSSGRLISRGQLVRTQKEIREALAWKAGYCTKKYPASSISRAVDHLVEDGMITEPEPTTIGFLFTIIKYDHYQNKENFKPAMKERRAETRTKPRTKTSQFDESINSKAFSQVKQSTNENRDETRIAGKVQLINNNENNGNNEIKNNTYTERQRSLFFDFQKWISNNYPSVSKMKQAFTIDEYLILKKRAGTKRLYSIIEDMENWEGLKNNSCAYKTFLTFFKKQGGESSKLSSIPKLPPEEQREAINEEMKNKKMVI